MATFSDPKILTDKSRLQEIYDLRVLAWENSPGKENINSTKYPDGYSDNLEDNSIHIIAEDRDNKIIGAARLTVCQDLDELPYPGIFKAFEYLMPNERPFLFYSRLVIHPDFRKTELRKRFDDFRVKMQMELKIQFGIATVKPKRLVQILPYGFKELGKTSPELDESYPFTSEHALLLLLPKDIQL